MNLFNYYGIETKPRQIVNCNIGLPYKGSKRKIAHHLLQTISDYAPQANIFYDCFGGGGSMSLIAYFNGYHTIYNELSTQAFLYFDFLCSQAQNKKGKYGILPDEFYQFVDKETFNKCKQEVASGKHSAYNSFVLYIYSFGNDCHSYFCDKEKEIFKKKGHYLMIDNDKDCALWWDNYFAENGSVNGIYEYMHKNIYPSLNWRERRAHFVNVTLKIEAIRVAGLKSHFKDGDFNTIRNMKNVDLVNMINDYAPHLAKKKYKDRNGSRNGSRGDKLKELKELKRLQQLEQLEQLERLERLERLQDLQRLNLSYNQIDFTQHNPRETIIYNDIPYKNTSQYAIKNFDYELFYEWAINKAKEGYNVFISEYDMPSDKFECIKEIQSFQSLNKKSTKDYKRVEKLFVPIV